MSDIRRARSSAVSMRKGKKVYRCSNFGCFVGETCRSSHLMVYFFLNALLNLLCEQRSKVIYWHEWTMEI